MTIENTNNIKKDSALKIFLHVHASGIVYFIIVIIMAIPFLLGFILDSVFWHPSATEDQYSKAEMIVQSVYEQKLNNAPLYEIPENYELEITDTNIKISINGSSGYVEAQVEKDNLVKIRKDFGFGYHMIYGFLCFFFMAISVLLIAKIIEDY